MGLSVTPALADQAPANADGRCWNDAGEAGGRELRKLFGTFLTGVTVVTAIDAAGMPVGFTANSFTSVSLDPPLVLVCVAKSGRSYDALCSSPRFGISILSDTQRDVSDTFAGRGGEKFEGATTWRRPGGAPLVESALGVIDCARESVTEAGDHVIVVGRVLGFAMNGGQPLGYFRGGYTAVTADLAALERSGDAIRVSGLIDCLGSVLLIRRPGEDRLVFPGAALRHGEDHRQALPRMLEKLGVTTEISALYSVFQDEDEPHTEMVFRGTCERVPEQLELPDGSQLVLAAESDRPWQNVAGRSRASVLKRFFTERAGARFGIYWDTRDGGRIAPLAAPPCPWHPQSPEAAGKSI